MMKQVVLVGVLGMIAALGGCGEAPEAAVEEAVFEFEPPEPGSPAEAAQRFATTAVSGDGAALVAMMTDGMVRQGLIESGRRIDVLVRQSVGQFPNRYPEATVTHDDWVRLQSAYASAGPAGAVGLPAARALLAEYWTLVYETRGSVGVELGVLMEPGRPVAASGFADGDQAWAAVAQEQFGDTAILLLDRVDERWLVAAVPALERAPAFPPVVPEDDIRLPLTPRSGELLGAFASGDYGAFAGGRDGESAGAGSAALMVTLARRALDDGWRATHGEPAVSWAVLRGWLEAYGLEESASDFEALDWGVPTDATQNTAWAIEDTIEASLTPIARAREAYAELLGLHAEATGWRFDASSLTVYPPLMLPGGAWVFAYATVTPAGGERRVLECAYRMGPDGWGLYGPLVPAGAPYGVLPTGMESAR